MFGCTIRGTPSPRCSYRRVCIHAVSKWWDTALFTFTPGYVYGDWIPEADSAVANTLPEPVDTGAFYKNVLRPALEAVGLPASQPATPAATTRGQR